MCLIFCMTADFSQTHGFKMVYHKSVCDIMALMEYGKENTFVQSDSQKVDSVKQLKS